MDISKENVLVQIEQLKSKVFAYFDKCTSALGEMVVQNWRENSPNYFWSKIPADLVAEADKLIEHIVTIGQATSLVFKKSLLVDDADLREIPILVKRMRSVIGLKRFYYSGPDVVHDEGTVLGFQPATQEEDDPITPEEAKTIYTSASNGLMRILQLADNYGSVSATDYSNQIIPAHKYRPNSAFIMMWMDAEQPELEDVKDTVCRTFDKFGIRAIRADDIEHEGIITQRILDEVRTSEFLFADLTGARPNVYYEVGFAHALGKRVILYRKKGTGLHFDLAGYNCPEYENLRDLKEKLTKRLESITNKQAHEGKAYRDRDTHH